MAQVSGASVRMWPNRKWMWRVVEFFSSVYHDSMQGGACTSIVRVCCDPYAVMRGEPGARLDAAFRGSSTDSR